MMAAAREVVHGRPPGADARRRLARCRDRPEQLRRQYRRSPDALDQQSLGLSNTHRVVNPPATVASRAQRLSIAFFHHPNYDASIECIAPPGQAKYPPVGAGDYRDLKYRQTRLVATGA